MCETARREDLMCVAPGVAAVGMGARYVVSGEVYVREGGPKGV